MHPLDLFGEGEKLIILSLSQKKSVFEWKRFSLFFSQEQEVLLKEKSFPLSIERVKTK